MTVGPEDKKCTLRQYLLFQALESMGAAEGGPALGMAEYMVAVEAVSTTALAHPEWDMDVRQEWAEWDKWAKKEKIS